jgi:O-antigen/teichoic acid export membrane protein
VPATSSRSSRGLVGGFSSGLFVKLAGVVLNFLAVPIALRTLGQERYAAFAALLGLAGWLGVGHFGLGSATGVLLSEVADDESRRRELFWRAVISTLLVVAAVSVIAFVPFIELSKRLVPQAPPSLEYELALATYYCFAAFTIMAVGATFQGLYVGMLRIEYVNWCSLVGQIVAVLALLTLPRLFGSMLALCVCVTLGTGATAIWFIIKGARDCPPPRGFRYSFRQSLPLFREGIGFLASSLSTLFYGGASLWVIALTFGAGQLATAAVMARLIQMYFSLIALLLIPLAPALRNALAADDRAWVLKALRKAGAFMCGTAICAACGSIFLGDAIISRWTATRLPSLSDWLLPLAVLVVVITWSYFWIYACFALRGSRPVAILAIIEVTMISAQFYVFGPYVTTSSSLLIMAGTMMVFSGCFLPVLVLKDLRQLKRRLYRQLDRSEAAPAAVVSSPSE